ncbi:MAG: sugar phosphate nucleotidyltransferase [Candidatus Diapherotrites archaeon]
MKSVVLGAGKGVRLRPLTNGIPKVMVKLGGRPILERILDSLVDAGIGEIEIVVGYLKENVENYFKGSYRGVPINYLWQEKQLGTAHAIGLAKEFIGEGDFLVMNGDVVVEKELITGLAHKDEFDTSDAVVVGREVDDPWRYGVMELSGERLEKIVEKPEFGSISSKIINAGIYRFNEKIFKKIEKVKMSKRREYEIVDAINALAKEGKVMVKIYDGLCADIGDKEDLKSAEELFKGK